MLSPGLSGKSKDSESSGGDRNCPLFSLDLLPRLLPSFKEPPPLLEAERDLLPFGSIEREMEGRELAPGSTVNDEGGVFEPD